jgi:hypothetical protein
MAPPNKHQRAQQNRRDHEADKVDEPTSAPPEQPVLAPAAAPCPGVDFAKGTVRLGDLRRPDGSPTFEQFTVTGGDVTHGRSAAW